MLFNVVLASWVVFCRGSIRCDHESNFLHTSDLKIGFAIIPGGVHAIRFTLFDVDFSAF